MTPPLDRRIWVQWRDGTRSLVQWLTWTDGSVGWCELRGGKNVGPAFGEVVAWWEEDDPEMMLAGVLAKGAR